MVSIAAASWTSTPNWPLSLSDNLGVTAIERQSISCPIREAGARSSP